MKKVEIKNKGKGKKCSRNFCRNCPDCKLIGLEENKPEIKSFLQLYAKEAESYFFYYALQDETLKTIV